MTSQASFENGSNPPSALGHLRVLDLAGPLGQHCSKLMADMGADVIKVEPPEGDSARYVAPFAKDNRHPDGSLYFLSFNTNKRSVTLDLTSRRGRDLLRRLAATADVLVESFSPGYMDDLGLGYKSLSRVNPALVMTSVTPFGQTGPYKDFLGTDLVAQALGGLMYIQGDDTKPPCAAPSEQAYQLASVHAAYGTLAALQYRRKTGRGQHVDVSMHEAVSHVLFTLARYAFNGEIVRRAGKLITAAPPPSTYYQCKDGKYVSMSVILPHQWKILVDWTGSETLADPVWEDRVFRNANQDVVVEEVAEFVRQFTREEFVKEAQNHHLSAIPINTLEDVVHSPQMKDRGYFVKNSHPLVGEHSYTGAPYLFSETPWRVHRPAPLLGQHQDEVLQELKETTVVKRQKAGHGRRTRAELPLKGIRILDFSKIWAGPFATRYLGDLGAEVIRIETNRVPEGGRVSGPVSPMFGDINRSKLSITLDFQTPEGLELMKRLVKESDFVLDNFPPRVLDRRGLGYETLKEVNPGIIMIQMPGYGNTGPYSDYVAFGQELMSNSGLTYLWGYPDSPQEARAKAYYTDFASAAIAACAMMIALEYRSQTGRGQYIELSQAEAFASTMGVGLLDYLVNGRSWEPVGNRNLTAAPHGCYPCRGEDQWCVIACWTQEHWESLCKTVGDLLWTSDPRFASQELRWKNQDGLDEAIGQWTKDYTPYQAMRMLQKAGVPAGAVQSAEQLYYDLHLRARNFIVEVEHTPRWGRMEHSGIIVGLSESPGRIVRGAPALAEHNNYVFGDILGMKQEEIDQMVEKKVIY